MALNAVRKIFQRIFSCFDKEITSNQSKTSVEDTESLSAEQPALTPQPTTPLDVQPEFPALVVKENSETCPFVSESLSSEVSSESLTEIGDLLHIPCESEVSPDNILCAIPLIKLGGVVETSSPLIAYSATVIEQRPLCTTKVFTFSLPEEAKTTNCSEHFGSNLQESIPKSFPVKQSEVCQVSDIIQQETSIKMATTEAILPTQEDSKESSPEVSSNGDPMQDSTGSEQLAEELNELHIAEESKNKSKEEKKSKKKEDKTIDHVLRALSSLHTTEEKLAALCKKYADLHEEHRRLQTGSKQNQRKLTVVTREKDQLQTEHTKAIMAKSKLEALCRELQKHNQVIRQESLQRAREEDEKRKEISTKFQTTIGEIQQQMQEHHDRNVKLREENQDLAGKLKGFIEQYETREKQVETMLQHREIETKLADAKLMKSEAILNEQQERSKKEKELLTLQAKEAQKKCVLLEAQLGMYKERYEEFQTTINKSNDMFQKFKSEMEKMSKRIKKLEKDGAAWKSKFENANKALLEMAEEKARYDKEKPVLTSKIQKLESLCRAMQAERLGRKVYEASIGSDASKPDDLFSKDSLQCEASAPAETVQQTEQEMEVNADADGPQQEEANAPSNESQGSEEGCNGNTEVSEELSS